MSRMLGQQITRLSQEQVKLVQQGRYEDAIKVATQVCGLARKNFGEEHPSYALSLNNLAMLYEQLGEMNLALPFFIRAVEIDCKAIKDMNFELNIKEFANHQRNLGLVYHKLGHYAEAEYWYEQTLQTHFLVYGKENEATATAIGDFGRLYFDLGRLGDAEGYLRDALEIDIKQLGNDNPRIADDLNSLGALYLKLGDLEAADRAFERVFDIDSKALKEGHPDFDWSSYQAHLNNLAEFHRVIKDYKGAEWFQQVSVHNCLKINGQDHPDCAQGLLNLASDYIYGRKFAEAQTLIRKVLRVFQKQLGKTHSLYGQALNALAFSYRADRQFQKAERLYRKALAVLKEGYGEYHPDNALILDNLANVCVVMHREAEALELMKQAAQIDDWNIQQLFSISSENQRIAYLNLFRGRFYRFLCLVQHHSLPPSAMVDAFDLVVRRKGLATESLAVQREAVLGGKYPEFAPALGELDEVSAVIAQETLAGPHLGALEDYRKKLEALENQRSRIEKQLVEQIPEMSLYRTIGLASSVSIAGALPTGSVLVEFVRYEVFDFEGVERSRWKSHHYLAFVLPAGQPDNLRLIELGKAAAIDEMIASLRSSITREPNEELGRDIGVEEDAAEQQTWSHGTNLRAAIFDPLVRYFDGRNRLFLAPDGDLTRLPFEVLPQEDGRYLIDDYIISYLSVGRDVLRFVPAEIGQSTAPVVVADPNFDLFSADTKSPIEQNPERPLQSMVRSGLRFDRLPGTRKEGKKIAALLGVKPVLEDDVLEAKIKRFGSPRILHIATHGFFLPDEPVNLNDGEPSVLSGGPERFLGAGTANPLLRSGLAMAGANTRLRGGMLPVEAEDGILNAEDVSGLNLLGTELVVLSACKTGLGEAHVGEGVFGLRRAFVLAGAKTLVMSLWKVPDKETQEMMVAFYRKLLKGESRVQALREAQRLMKEQYPDKCRYWGAFICQGDPRPLSQKNETAHNSNNERTISVSCRVDGVCPQCRKKCRFDTWIIIDAEERPDLWALCSDRKIHRHTCPNGHVSDSNGLVLLHDGVNKRVIFSPKRGARPEEYKNILKALTDALQRLLSNSGLREYLKHVEIVEYELLPMALRGRKAKEFENLQVLLKEIYSLDRSNNAAKRTHVIENILSLGFIDREQHPHLWAGIQVALGTSLASDQSGNRSESIEKAIRVFKGALTVFKQKAFPEQWAMTQNNLGNAYWDRVQGRRSRNLEDAIRAFKAALGVYTRQAFPKDWAEVQMNLGSVYSLRLQGTRSRNLELATQACNAALRVFNLTDFRREWQMVQHNLNRIRLQAMKGDGSGNLKSAKSKLNE